jgi:hypothetical protein
MLSPAMTEYYRELNANLVLEEGMQDTRKWTDKAASTTFQDAPYEDFANVV